MQKIEFDSLFDTELAEPLITAGFVAKSKSLHFFRDTFHIALIRLGGRMATSGTVASVLCLRHSFLRLVEPLSNASAWKYGVFDFPFKLTQKDFADRKPKLRYQSRLLNYDYDRFEFECMRPSEVTRSLSNQRNFLLDVFLPLASTKTPAEVRDEILRFGTNGWCERLWIEDYDSYLKIASGGPK